MRQVILVWHDTISYHNIIVNPYLDRNFNRSTSTWLRFFDTYDFSIISAPQASRHHKWPRAIYCKRARKALNIPISDSVSLGPIPTFRDTTWVKYGCHDATRRYARISSGIGSCARNRNVPSRMHTRGYLWHRDACGVNIIVIEHRKNAIVSKNCCN